MDHPIVVLIHITVAPDRRDALRATIEAYAQADMARTRGFARSVLCATPDGLLNVAHWRSEAAYLAYLQGESSARIRAALESAASAVRQERYEVLAVVDGPVAEGAPAP
jgi:quinol monooxygenase YgiN